MSSTEGQYVTPAEVHTDSFSESDALNNETIDGHIALRFPDATYYVKESSIILGRDVRLQDFLEKHKDVRVTTTHPVSQTPTRGSHERNTIERTVDVPEPDPEMDDDDEDFSPTEPRFASLIGGIATFDINLHQMDPSGNEPFLALHPPGDPNTGKFPKLTAISKRHLRLFMDEENDRWMLEVLGRNGTFVNDEHYECGELVPLEHLSRIGIADLDFKVLYHDESEDDLDESPSYWSDEEEVEPEDSETTPELSTPHKRSKQPRASMSGEESEDDADAEDIEPVTPKSNKPTTKLKLSLKIKSEKPDKSDKPGKDEKQPKTPKDKDKDKDKDKVPKKPKETSEEAHKKILSLLAPGEEPGRRKGPGRPPANGVMSKREMRERQKAMADAARREREGSAADIASPSGDVGADADLKMDEDGKANNKKRKRSNTTGDPKAETGDRKKRQSPEKSPEPTEDQFTAEQLAPPGLTYVVIIYRILQDLHPQQLNLQQLYREMKKRYPYYRFRPKPGWESSVRHTVSAENFIKGEKDGKGFKYTYNPDKPPAPQKQKQVTTHATHPTNPYGYNSTASPGPFPTGNYTNGPYPYGNTYQQPGPPQNSYGQNLPLHNQRPLADDGPKPAQYQSLQTPTSQIPPARNPQNSPYPINPTVAGLSGLPQAIPDGSSQTYNRASAPSLASQQLANNKQHTSQPSETTPTPTTTAPLAQNTKLSQPSQTHALPPSQAHQHIDLIRTNGSIPQGQTTPQTHGPPSAGPPRAMTPQSSVTTQQVSQPAHLQQPSRPPSQPSPASTSTPRPKTPFQATPSEELAQGRMPRTLLDFEANMKRLASNMPQRQQDIETRALDQAMKWIKENPTSDFRPEPGMDTYTVSVISNMKSMIQKQDLEITRLRQTGGSAPRPQA